ncbi:MAG: AMP-binding protein, partial [Myxococcales bacterium]|nr:AMP-binding protein [Myxococcales bacterium]
GEPKGVMLTHRAQCQNVSAVLHSLPLSAEDRALSFLPWAHSFGQTCELHAMIALGASMAISRGPSHLVDDLREVRPTALVSVPRIFNRLYDDVHRRLRQRPGVLRRLFAEGRRLAAARREGPLSLRDRLSLEAADRAVFAPIRARFGGRLRYVFSGGAPLGNETRTLIDDLGIRVYEGYGLTEAGPVVTANRPEARRLGSVGRPLLGVSVRIDDERGPPGTGEICVKSPGVMRGYHRREAESAAAFDADGWLRTGDVGYLDEDGYLHLTGRLTEQYKLDSGLFVAPVPLEEELKRSAFIKNIMMYGEGRPHNVALVVVDLDALNRWAEQRELHFDSTATMLASRRVHDLVLAEIGERSRSHQAYERIKDVHLTDVDFTTDNGMLTPTGRVRRSNAFAAHAAALAALYPESGPP